MVFPTDSKDGNDEFELLLLFRMKWRKLEIIRILNIYSLYSSNFNLFHDSYLLGRIF